jgi:hypothetical protein
MFGNRNNAVRKEEDWLLRHTGVQLNRKIHHKREIKDFCSALWAVIGIPWMLIRKFWRPVRVAQMEISHASLK